MKFLILIFLLTLINPVYSQQNKTMGNLEKLISDVQIKFAPDKRTALFHVSPKLENKNQIVLSGETDLINAKEALLKNLNELGYKTIDSIKVLPGNYLGNKIYGVIDVSVANLRTEPKQEAELASQALLGSRVKLLKESDGWALVQTPDEYIAWMEIGSFIPMDNEQIKEWESAKRIIFTSINGFCFSDKSITPSPVSDLVAGNLLKELDRDGEFIKVEFPDKRIGYVLSSNCEEFNNWLNSQQLTGGDIVNTAKRFMGVPYLWGGTSGKLMDCSGFTRTVFLLNGIYLPRDASQQVNVGNLVDTKDGFSNLKPGDLLFFGRKATATSKERITHVGIYIGNEEFIHESGMVQINSFDKSKSNYSHFRYTQFVKAKRIINSAGKNGVYLLKNVQY